MAITEPFTGTRSQDTTEWSLTTNSSYDTGDAQTTDGVFQLFLDVSTMAAGNILQVRVYEKVRSGDTQRVAEEWILANAQATPIFVTPSLILLNGWDFTIDSLSGTYTVLWSIRQVA